MSPLPSLRAAAYLAWCIVALASVGAPGVTPIRAAAQISAHTSSSGHAGLFVDEAGEEAEVDSHRADDLGDESESHDDALGILYASLRSSMASAPRVRASHGHDQDAAGTAYDPGVNGARAPPRV
jgi:hypothetical protein